MEVPDLVFLTIDLLCVMKLAPGFFFCVGEGRCGECPSV